MSPRGFGVQACNNINNIKWRNSTNNYIFISIVNAYYSALNLV